MKKPNKELVLLVEPHGNSEKLRAFEALPSQHMIVERCHLSNHHVFERVWIHQHGERAITGQRVFRELPQPAPREEPENPIYDELVIKEPIPLTEAEAKKR